MSKNCSTCANLKQYPGPTIMGNGFGRTVGGREWQCTLDHPRTIFVYFTDAERAGKSCKDYKKKV